RSLVELGAVCVFDDTDVPREFNRRDLHAETKTQKRNLALAGETRGVDFSFNTANAKSAGNQDADNIFQLGIDAMLQGFGFNKFQIDSTVLPCSGVSE